MAQIGLELYSQRINDPTRGSGFETQACRIAADRKHAEYDKDSPHHLQSEAKKAKGTDRNGRADQPVFPR
jgi:hypothetical protein